MLVDTTTIARTATLAAGGFCPFTPLTTSGLRAIVLARRRDRR
jgi:hypothetical protein